MRPLHVQRFCLKWISKEIGTSVDKPSVSTINVPFPPSSTFLSRTIYAVVVRVYTYRHSMVEHWVLLFIITNTIHNGGSIVPPIECFSPYTV